ncbi:MAG TPA: cyanophycin synthetase [Thermomicrobiales bacterium]|nr:cyanophycin synthetase [Thermomicrobiales bacterium]
MEYGAALDYLLGFTDWRKPVVHRPEAIHNLPRMRALLDLLDAPDGRYRAVVIAGTKGKGSTAAILAACLRAAGYRTGLYSQPHLHEYRERVRVDGRPIGADELVAIVERLQAAVPLLLERRPELGPPSTYDLGTALALVAFAERAVECAVLEVGLGGRFDSVNTVVPLVSVIASLSLDHTAVLGDTIEQIALEKAGIIKPGVPVVVQPQIPAAWAVVARTARERGAPLHRVGDAVRVTPVAATPDPLTGRQAVRVEIAADFPRPGAPARAFAAELALLGHVQRANAATALTAALLLEGLRTEDSGLSGLGDGGRFDDATLARGLAAARWPGRLEIVRDAPLTIVDGAHNADSAEQLRRALADLFPARPLVLVLGTSVDKDIPGIVRALVPGAARVVLTASSHPRSAPLDRLRAEAAPYGAPLAEAATAGAALDLATALAGELGPTALIGVTGSLFLVADAREHLGLADGALAV